MGTHNRRKDLYPENTKLTLLIIIGQFQPLVVLISSSAVNQDKQIADIHACTAEM